MPISKKTNRLEIIILIITMILGAFLYFRKLEHVPSGFYVDEALTGYNAYSLLTTGKDEYGKYFPVALRFFGSYTPSLYTYFTIPFVYFLGLKVTAVRMLSAISGVLGIVLIYFFVKSLNFAKTRYAPVLGALLFAISPWNVLFSRVGYEVNLAFFVFSLGIYLLWKAMHKPKLFLLSLPILSVSTYISHAQKYLAPIFILGYILFFSKKIFNKKSRSHLIKGLILATVLQIPNFYLMTTPSFYTKANLFYWDVVLGQAEKINRYLPMVISLPLALVREFLSQYLTYYSPRSLFFLPDPDIQRSMPELAVLYFWMILPYAAGLYFVLKNTTKTSSRYLLLLLLISPLPTTLVGDPFSTQRALPLLLPMILIITVGLDRIISGKRFVVWASSLFVLVCFSLLLLWRSYFVLLPKERARTWSYGFEQLSDKIINRPNIKFVIDQTRSKPAYIELLFYLKYPPKIFHEELGSSIRNNYYKNTNFIQNYKFGNVETRNISWKDDVYEKAILVGDELAISKGQAKEHFLVKVFEIRSPVDEIIFVGYETNPDLKCSAIRNKNEHCKKGS